MIQFVPGAFMITGYAFGSHIPYAQFEGVNMAYSEKFAIAPFERVAWAESGPAKIIKCRNVRNFVPFHEYLIPSRGTSSNQCKQNDERVFHVRTSP